MIYVTVGTMFLDFTRLTRAMDAWAANQEEPVIMQIGMGKETPRHTAWFRFLPHEETLEIQRHARVIVAHAGIGALRDALEVRRPFILAPRRRQHQEHLNEHQLDLAEAVVRRGWGAALYDMNELPTLLAEPVPFPQAYQPAAAPLVAAVRRMVQRVAGP